MFNVIIAIIIEHLIHFVNSSQLLMIIHKTAIHNKIIFNKVIKKTIITIRHHQDKINSNIKSNVKLK